MPSFTETKQNSIYLNKFQLNVLYKYETFRLSEFRMFIQKKKKKQSILAVIHKSFIMKLQPNLI